MYVANRNALGNVYSTSQGNISIRGGNHSLSPDQQYGVTYVEDKVWEEILKNYGHAAEFKFNIIFAQATEKSLHAKAIEFAKDRLSDARLILE